MVKEQSLVTETQLKIRFCEVDSMGIVWHGSYVKYLEDGREDFGAKYGLGYLNIFNNGYYAPLVKVNCEYKRPLKYGDQTIIETKYIFKEAAKIQFEYKILTIPDRTLVLKAETLQVFLDKNYELVLVNPPFFEAWKVNHGFKK